MIKTAAAVQPQTVSGRATPDLETQGPVRIENLESQSPVRLENLEI